MAKCLTCKHWDGGWFKDSPPPEFGECLRFPPVVAPDFQRRDTIEEEIAYWVNPTTRSNHVCGEYATHEDFIEKNPRAT